uniref:Reverse transcriptase domain-containing protein n=1 Tax=Nicotiana tabacum TaxID=4097 RepID=A0A1S3Z7B0_TOBAC|nr:PREDICTED: uncharacterized protein LOC107783848 [Nicotiana tabacum]
MDQIPGAPPMLKGSDSRKYTQLLFKPSATPELILKRFKMSNMPKYDGTSDPQEHITTYTTAVKGYDLAPHKIESVLLKKLGETLTKGALTWKVHVRKADIFKITQGESELLMELVTKFQKERMLLPALRDECAAEAFTKTLNPRSSYASWKWKESLLDFQATTWVDVHNQYESNIKIKDDQLGFSVSANGQDREKNKEKLKDNFDTDRRSSRGREDATEDKEISGSLDSSYPRLSEYNFNVSIVELVSAMRNIKETWFLKPMRSDPSQKDSNLWCEYHGTNDYQTGDCRHLCKEVETLQKNGHLRELLSDRTKIITTAIAIKQSLRKQERILHI